MGKSQLNMLVVDCAVREIMAQEDQLIQVDMQDNSTFIRWTIDSNDMGNFNALGALLPEGI